MTPEKFAKLMEVVNDSSFKEYDTIFSLNYEEAIEDKPIVMIYHYMSGYLISDLIDAGFSVTIFVSLKFAHCLEIWVTE